MPVAAYDATGNGADGCPEGSNCLSLSTLSSYTGLRLADKGRCVPTPASDPDGMLACDLLNGQLIHDRAERCEVAARARVGEIVVVRQPAAKTRPGRMAQVKEAAPQRGGEPCPQKRT